MFDIDENTPLPIALAYLGSGLLGAAGLVWLSLLFPPAVAIFSWAIMGCGLLLAKGLIPLAYRGMELFAKGVGKALGAIFDL
jgi:hypothetical protein